MVKFNPYHASQGLVFELQFRRLAALVSDMEQIRQGASVEVLAGEAAPLLDRWVFGERPAACLMGLSTGHPVLEGTGRLITTSDLCLISEMALELAPCRRKTSVGASRCTRRVMPSPG